MSEGNKPPNLVVILAAIIGAVGAMAVCGVPIVTRLVNIYLPATTPTPITVQTPSPSPPNGAFPVSPTDRYHFVSLRDVGKPESGNLGLQAGVRTLGDIDFEIGWLVTTQSQGDPDNAETVILSVQQDIPNPSKVHFLLQASWAVGQSQEFGNIYVAFADGHTISEPLRVGYNIRDWSQTNAPLTAPNTQQAWEGIGWDGRKGVVDVLTIDIPSDYRQSRIVQIEIRDESLGKLNSSSPGIHLWAITIEQ